MSNIDICAVVFKSGSAMEELDVDIFCCRQHACPLLPPHQRPPRPWSRRGQLLQQQHQHNNSIYSDDSSSGRAVLPAGPSQAISSPVPSCRSTTPRSLPSLAPVSFGSQADRQQQRGASPRKSGHGVTGAVAFVSGTPCRLIDGLTQFFTPSDKRKSRVSLNSYSSSSVVSTLLTAAAQRRSKSQRAANKLVRKSRLLQASRGRKRSCGPARNDHGLFDGLSHLFTAPHGDQPLKLGAPGGGGFNWPGAWGRDGQGMDERLQASGDQSGGQRRTSGVRRRRGYSGAPSKGKSPCSSLHASHHCWQPALLRCSLRHSLTRLLYLTCSSCSVLAGPRPVMCLWLDELGG